MNFESYPLDKHICYFTLGSLTSLATSNQNFTLGILNFEPSAQVTALDYYVQVNELPYSKQIKVDGGIVKQRTGFEIQLDRNIMSYLIDYYIPSGILVVASWVMSNIYQYWANFEKINIRIFLKTKIYFSDQLYDTSRCSARSNGITNDPVFDLNQSIC